MTTEQKAKAYDKALKAAEQIHKFSSNLAEIKRMEELFPELKESEEEQSKKWILEYLHDGLRKSDEQFKGQFKAAIAWLEKQGESKSYSWRPTKEQYEALDYAYNSCSDTERGNYYEGVLETLIEDLHRLEKQGEQKPADKVEPKFKTGDKVYSLRDRFECTIESIDETTYYGDTTNFDIKDQDNWKLVEQNPAWSEEDELNLNQAIYVCHQNGYNAVENWLKSLRPQK